MSENIVINHYRYHLGPKRSMIVVNEDMSVDHVPYSKKLKDLDFDSQRVCPLIYEGEEIVSDDEERDTDTPDRSGLLLRFKAYTDKVFHALQLSQLHPSKISVAEREALTELLEEIKLTGPRLDKEVLSVLGDERSEP